MTYRMELVDSAYVFCTHLYMCINVLYIYIYIYISNSSLQAGYDTRSVFNRSLTGLNSEFSFSYTGCYSKVKELCLLYYFPIAGGRRVGFILLPKVLALCETQTASPRIWSWITASISYDGNHYTTSPFLYIYIYKLIHT